MSPRPQRCEKCAKRPRCPPPQRAKCGPPPIPPKCIPPPPMACIPPPMPPPPPRPKAGDARASAVPNAPTMRYLKSLLFIPSSFVAWQRRIPSLAKNNNQEAKIVQRLQIKNATVSDAEVTIFTLMNAKQPHDNLHRFCMSLVWWVYRALY